MRVLKFGGSSLRDADGMRRVGQIVKSCGPGAIVVISAVQGVTDSLVSFMSRVRSEEEVQAFVSELRNRHMAILNEVAEDEAVRRAAAEQLNERAVRLERILYGITYLEEITPRTKDLVQSFGERMSVVLLAAHLNCIDVKAVPMDADRIGIVTDGTFGSAMADLEASKPAALRLREPVERGEVPVVTGFFGRGPHGFVTLFGRNGTDYSAAVVASITSAGSLEIWKDVDGFMSADPRIVPDAVPIERLSYDEAAELSYFGAKVLHPRTVEPVRASGTVIRLLNVFRPEAPGTFIGPEGDAAQGLIKSISCMSGMAMIKAYGGGLGSKTGVMVDVSGQLSAAGVNIFSAATSQTCISLLVDGRDLDRAEAALSRVGHSVGRVEMSRGLSLLCLVGEGLAGREAVASKVLGAVAGLGVNVSMISAGASTAALQFTVADEDLVRTVRTVHEGFFGG